MEGFIAMPVIGAVWLFVTFRPDQVVREEEEVEAADESVDTSRPLTLEKILTEERATTKKNLDIRETVS